MRFNKLKYWSFITSFTLIVAIWVSSLGLSSFRRDTKPSFGEIASTVYRQHSRYRGVVEHWIIGEGGGTKVRDISGFGNDGTLTDMDPATDWVLGQFGYVLDLDGSNDCILADKTGITGSQNRTINLWILHAGEVTVDETFVFWGDVNGTAANGERYEFRIDSVNADRLRTEVQGGFNVGTSTVVDDGNWHMVTSVLDGISATDIVHYMDGVLDASSTSGAQAINTSADSVVHIGCNDSNVGLSRFNSGRFDEARIYNRALSAREVWNLYTDPFLEFHRPQLFVKAPAAAPAPTVSGRPSVLRLLMQGGRL